MRSLVLASVLVFVAIAASVPSTGHAIGVRFPERRHSPVRADLPLRGSIFIVPLRYRLPNVRWVRGSGSFTKKSLGLVARIDYIADGDALLEIDGDQLYTISASAPLPAVPHLAGLHRDEGYCGAIHMALDAPVAAMRARLTREDRVENYWLADARDVFTLEPACDPSYAPMETGTVELFVTFADGRERSLHSPIAVARIPVHTIDDDEAPPIDLRPLAALLVSLAALLASRVARPRVASSGVVIRGYLPRLRFRIRLPRARVHRR